MFHLWAFNSLRLAYVISVPIGYTVAVLAVSFELLRCVIVVLLCVVLL